MTTINKIRNIGISAHIDSGKTTLSERVLYYCGKIHQMGDVRGRGKSAKMDSLDLEIEKGITIASAATTCHWDQHQINLIDTPGHVDFTVEVERSLRALDGCVMLFTAVEGVQSQSITVDKQIKRYHVPRIAFINKMDRVGANPQRVIEAIRDKLNLQPVLLQLNIGEEDKFVGHIDLIHMRAVYCEGDHGEQLRYEEVPDTMMTESKQLRSELLETLSMYNDQLLEQLMNDEEIRVEQIHKALRNATLSLKIVPVLLGSAYKNKGIQDLLDAVCRYLPSPIDREEVEAFDLSNDKLTILSAENERPLCALAFKLTEDDFGQLTYMRIYQGQIIKGSFIFNSRTQKKVRVSRIVRMNADERIDENAAFAGDIVALVGIDCRSGDTFCDSLPGLNLSTMFIPQPVIDLSIKAKHSEQSGQLSKALNRFQKEDPTFVVKFDHESSETIISGMGELHLEIYAERICREFSCDVILGKPKVAYRETITKEVEFNYRHVKRTGGPGEYAHVIGTIKPFFNEDGTTGDFNFQSQLKGNNIPREFVSSIKSGFKDSMNKGFLANSPIIGVDVTLLDGDSHSVDSSDRAFKAAARFAFREAFYNANPVILEPVMKVECESPIEYQGIVTGDLIRRRGILVGTDMIGGLAIINAEVPLAQMFGYSNDLRSITQGNATFSMEFGEYRKAPAAVQKEIISKNTE